MSKQKKAMTLDENQIIKLTKELINNNKNTSVNSALIDAYMAWSVTDVADCQTNRIEKTTAIRSLIKKMVAAESKAKPLSDNKIAKELEQQGHIVARRTVAKYRESMQIAPSSQRKSLV